MNKTLRPFLTTISIASIIAIALLSCNGQTKTESMLASGLDRTVMSSSNFPFFEPLPFSASNFSPKPNATNVPLNITISMSFTRLPSVAELHLTPEVPIANRSMEGSIIEGQKYIFHLSEPLQPNTTYIATITYGQENNTRTDSWNFTTTDTANLSGAELPYAAHAFHPEPNATNVDLNTTIAISFGRPPSICELSLTPNTPVKERVFEADGFGGTYVFYLAEPLQPQTTYTVIITFGQETAPEGFAPTSTRTWNFTTLSQPQSRSTTSSELSNIILIAGAIVAIALLSAGSILVKRRSK